MKKLLISLFIVSGFMIPAMAYSGYNQIEQQEYRSVKIPKQYYFKGILLEGISSEVNKSGDLVKIQNPFDISIKDDILIPANSVFIGQLLESHKAKDGVNGALKISIDKIIYPDKKEFIIKAHVYSPVDGITIGGELAPRTNIRKVVNKTQGWGSGVLQALPDGPRMFGKETGINAGSDVIIQLDEDIDFYIKKDN